MALKVVVGTNVNRVTTSTSSSASRVNTSIVNPSVTQTATELGGLQGVDLDGLQNGYTLVYDSTSGNWEAAPASDVAANIQSIDGGTY